MNDREILRSLACQYLEICAKSEINIRRQKWRKLNSLQMDRPLIYVRAFAWEEMPQSKLHCEDHFLRKFENFFRYQIFWDSLGDDSIFEPWVTLPAVHEHSGWGVQSARHYSDEERGSFKIDYALIEESDFAKMCVPCHKIDEKTTSELAAKLDDALGGIIPVDIDRGPAYKMWTADISTSLGHLRGMENFMLDMMDNPEWLHQILKFMSDGILKAQDEAEKAGDWGLTDHCNQAMPYAEELPDPAPNVHGAPRKQLWCFMASQEYTMVSPEQQQEFLLQYQKPIMEHFGLSAYGCCEDLSRKIKYLREINNLRRIAISPFADVQSCAEQIGDNYVASYRPSPADMVSYSWDAERIRRTLDRDFEFLVANRCPFDITLKDVETVGNDPNRVRDWVKLTRERIDHAFSRSLSS